MLQQPPIFNAPRTILLRVLLIISVIIFFVLSQFLVLQSTEIFNSPDEAANYYFARQFKEKSNFFLLSPSGAELPETARLRSALRDGAYFTPVGFIGFTFFLGLATKIFSFEYLPYFLSALSGLALLAWFAFFKKIFGRQVAFLSVFLLLLHPAYFAYNLRPYFPNILFVNFLIFAAYFFSKAVFASGLKLPSGERMNLENPFTAKTAVKQYFFSFLFGLTLGLALMIRPSEALWVFLSILVILIFVRRNFKLSSFLVAVLGLLLVFLPVLGLQKITYGNFFTTGYHLTLPENSKSFLSFLMPFGFDIVILSKNIFDYLIYLFWWLAVPFFFGLIFIPFKSASLPYGFRRKISLWFIIFILVFLWLSFYYGSWQVSDRLDEKTSVGVSFVRYFLPIYILSVPFVALGIWRFIRMWRKIGKTIGLFIVPLIVILSLRVVWWEGDESVLNISRTLKGYGEIRNQAIRIVPKNTVILTERGDKIFFPAREVVPYFRKKEEMEIILSLMNTYDFWYETILNDKDARRENEVFWNRFGLEIEKVASLGGGHSLYKIKQMEDLGV